MVSLHYTLTKADYVNFYTWVMWDAGTIRKKRAQSIIKQVSFVGIFLVVLYFSGVFRYLSTLTITIILLMFGTSLLPLFTGRSSADKQGEEIADDPENAEVFAETFLQVTDAGLHLKSENVEINYSWKAIVKKTETESYYFLFTNAIQAIIIPKRILQNNEEKAAFQRLLLRNITLDAELKDGVTDAGE